MFMTDQRPYRFEDCLGMIELFSCLKIFHVDATMNLSKRFELDDALLAEAQDMLEF